MRKAGLRCTLRFRNAGTLILRNAPAFFIQRAWPRSAFCGNYLHKTCKL